MIKIGWSSRQLERQISTLYYERLLASREPTPVIAEANELMHLTQKIKERANVPVYVLEFLLGQYCSSDDDAIIESGVQQVKRILVDNFVRPDNIKNPEFRISDNTGTRNRQPATRSLAAMQGPDPSDRKLHPGKRPWALR